MLIPVLKVLIRNPEGREIYENVVDFKQPILLPPDVSEFECKTKQVGYFGHMSLHLFLSKRCDYGLILDNPSSGTPRVVHD